MHKSIRAGLLPAALVAALFAMDASALGGKTTAAPGLTIGVHAPAAGIERADGHYRADGVAITLGQPKFTARVAAPEAMAREFVAARRTQLGLDARGVASLARSFQRDGHEFTVVRFEQRQQGLPVYGSDLAVSVMPNGRVIYVSNSSVSGVGQVDAVARISQDAAIVIARNHLGASALDAPEARQMVYVGADGSHLVWRVVADPVGTPYGDWEVLVDAHSGAVLRAEDKAAYETGSGTIWTPDPLSYERVAYGTPGYVDGNNADTPELTAALVPVTLDGITLSAGMYSLAGPYAVCEDWDTPHTTGECPTQASSDFSVTRSATSFDAVMGYYHITEYLKYVNETLGVPAMPIAHPGGVHYDPHGFNGADNSSFSAGTEKLRFGEGGVDDAQDADVLIHELGHGIHHFLTGGHLSQVEGLSEGFGDYTGAAWSRDYPNQWTPADPAYYWIYSWDGHNPFWSGRVLNYEVNHTYAQIANQEIHSAGQYWSSCNLIARDILGGAVFDKAYFQGISMTGGSTNQKAAAQAVINAAAALGYPQAQIDVIGDAYNSGNTGGHEGCTYGVTVPVAVAGPVVGVTPTSLDATAEAGDTTSDTLTISNTGNAALDWSIDTADTADCASPATTPWIAFTPASGSIAEGGADASVDVTFDATDLAVGSYTTNVCVHSNDTTTPVVAVPVTFTVTQPDDTIFRDGFDGEPAVCSPAQLIQDPSFEATNGSGGDNPFWQSQTTQGDSVFWGLDADTEHVRTGNFAAWFGGYGTSVAETHEAWQAVVIPAGAPRWLNFWRWISGTGSGPSNIMTISIDDTPLVVENLADFDTDPDWVLRSFDIGSYADGGSHTLKFSYVHADGGVDSDYYVDDVTIDCDEGQASAKAGNRPMIVHGGRTKRSR